MCVPIQFCTVPRCAPGWPPGADFGGVEVLQPQTRHKGSGVGACNPRPFMQGLGLEFHLARGLNDAIQKDRMMLSKKARKR